MEFGTRATYRLCRTYVRMCATNCARNARSGTCSELAPNVFRQHEAHILLHDIELFDVRSASLAEPVTRRLTSSSGALAPEVMPTTRLPSNHSSRTCDSLSMRCASAPWSRATSTSRFEFDELADPITSTRSQCGAIWRTAIWRFVVA